MRWVIFGLVIVHGLIHFMGFCKAYGLGDFAQLTQSISKSICPGPPKGSRKVKYKASRFMLVTDIERQKFDFRKSVAIRTEEEFKARFGRKSGMDWSKQWMYWLAYSKLAIKSARIADVVEHSLDDGWSFFQQTSDKLHRSILNISILVHKEPV